MKNFLISLFLSLTISSFLFTSLFVPTATAAKNLRDAFDLNESSDFNTAASKAGYNTEDSKNRTLIVISQIINIALSLLGVIFLLLIIYAGYLWMTARGDEQQATKARDIITRAVIGLIIVLAAYAIAYYIVDYFTKDTLV